MLAPSPEANGFTRPRLLSEHVYDQLKDMILKSELRPGEALIEEKLASQWGISRTPLRAALTRLEKDGLVKTIPHRGCLVTEINTADVRDVYQAREAIEVMTTILATPHIPATELEAMTQLFEQIEADLARDAYDSYIPSDAIFHAMILRYVSNRVLLEMLERIYNQITRIRNMSHNQLGQHMRDAFHEHQHILDALHRRDAAAAGQAMSEHLRGVTQRAIIILETTLAQPHR
jgi:DNA-binding GntR family transcriptional regulator